MEGAVESGADEPVPRVRLKNETSWFVSLELVALFVAFVVAALGHSLRLGTLEASGVAAFIGLYAMGIIVLFRVPTLRARSGNLVVGLVVAPLVGFGIAVVFLPASLLVALALWLMRGLSWGELLRILCFNLVAFLGSVYYSTVYLTFKQYKLSKKKRRRPHARATR